MFSERWCEKSVKRLGGKKGEMGSPEKHRFFTALKFPNIKKIVLPEDLQKAPHYFITSLTI